MSDKNNPNTNSNAGRLSKWGILALGIGAASAAVLFPFLDTVLAERGTLSGLLSPLPF